MTPQEIAEWIGVAVFGVAGFAMILIILGCVAWVAVYAWGEWKRDR